MKIRPVEAKLFHVDGGTAGQTDGGTDGGTGGRTDGGRDGRTDGRRDGQRDSAKLIVAFRNFANAPKKKENESMNINSKNRTF